MVTALQECSAWVTPCTLIGVEKRDKLGRLARDAGLIANSRVLDVSCVSLYSEVIGSRKRGRGINGVAIIRNVEFR